MDKQAGTAKPPPGTGFPAMAAALVFAAAVFAAAFATVAAEPGPALRFDAAEAELMPDGALRLPDGREIVPAGLDTGLGLAPPSDAYRAEIGKLAAEGPWRIAAAGRDRYDRLTGRIETAAGEWLQERLLRLGLARFAGGIEDRDATLALLSAERAARAEGLGVWRDPRFIIRQADRPEEIYNGFRIVEGWVMDVGRGDGVVYLNFGPDWRTDFTAGITLRLTPEDLLVAQESGLAQGAPPQSVFELAGRRLRLRGVVRRYNGPYMEIAGPDQIELIGEPGGSPIGADPVMLRSADPWDSRPVSGSTL